MRVHFVVPPIRSREIAAAQGSSVRHREDALQPLDLGTGRFRLHPSQYPTERFEGQLRSASPDDVGIQERVRGVNGISDLLDTVLAVAGFAVIIGFDRECAFYPTVLIVIASYYVLFA